MIRNFSLWTVLSATFLIGVPTHGRSDFKDFERLPNSPWSSQVSLLADGQLHSCHISRVNAAGVEIGIQATNLGSIDITFIYSRWRLSLTDKYTITAHIDGVALPLLPQHSALDVQGGTVKVAPKSLIETLDGLAGGRNLSLSIQGRKHDLSLDGSGEAIQSLIRCVKKYAEPETAALYKLGQSSAVQIPFDKSSRYLRNIPGGWLASYETATNGQFIRCVVEKQVDTNVQLQIWVEEPGQLVLAIIGVRWQRLHGRNSKTTLKIDGAEKAFLDFSIVDSNQAVFFLDPSEDNITSLRKMRFASVESKGVVAKYRVTSATSAVDALLSCVKEKGGEYLASSFENLAEPSRGQTEAEPAQPNKEPGPNRKNDSGDQKLSSGTAFAVSNIGHLLTNAHVVSECRSVQISIPDGALVAAKVVAKDTTNDLALLKAEVSTREVATFRSSVSLGEQVAAFGFPLTGLLSAAGNFTIGNVTAVEGVEDDHRMLQISAPIQAGNSGGPLVDNRGNVVGIVVSKLNSLAVFALLEDLPQNINFAIKSGFAITFLEKNGVTSRTSASDEGLEPAALAQKLKSFTFLVICHQR